jgi:hypothetical protein
VGLPVLTENQDGATRANKGPSTLHRAFFPRRINNGIVLYAVNPFGRFHPDVVLKQKEKECLGNILASIYAAHGRAEVEP